MCGNYNDLWQKIFQVQSLFFFMQGPLFPHFVHSSSNKPYPTWDQVLLLWNRLNNNSCTLMQAAFPNLMRFKNGTPAALHCSHCSFLQGLYFLGFSSSLDQAQNMQQFCSSSPVANLFFCLKNEVHLWKPATGRLFVNRLDVPCYEYFSLSLYSFHSDAHLSASFYILVFDKTSTVQVS